MDVQNALIIIGTLIMWTALIHMVVPTQVGRSLIGIVGAVVIGATFAINGITVFKVVV